MREDYTFNKTTKYQNTTKQNYMTSYVTQPHQIFDNIARCI